MAESQPTRLVAAARFTVGGITVTPAARTLAAAAAERVIEPRVMQVLVTLHDRCGEVVGRDELVDACWDGRIVGEDAVNRAILKLRRALDELDPHVTIETIPRVGYRLRIDTAVPAQTPEPPPPPRRKRPLLAGLGLLAGIVAGLCAVAGARHERTPMRVVTVQPLHVAAGDAVAQRLSQDFASDLSRAVLGHDGRLEFADTAGGPDQSPAFAVRGSIASVGSDLHAVITVSERDDPAILWSHDYTAPIADPSGLREQVSTNVAAVLVCAVGTRGVPDRIDAHTTALYLETCSLHSGDHRREAYLLRQVVAQAPQFADAWASLAISLTLLSEDAGDAEARSMRQEATSAAQRARDLDRHCGNAYYAQALLLPGSGNWVRREGLIRAGLVAEPDNPQLYDFLGADLAAIGREQDSVAAYRRAVALDPLFPGKEEGLAQALDDAGDLAGALAVVRHMEETWPDNDYTWQMRFETAARFGDARQAAAMLDDPTAPSFTPGQKAAWRSFLSARMNRSERNVDRTVASLMQARRAGALSDAGLVIDLAQLHHPALGLPIALRMSPRVDTDFWFRSYLAPLRADPRFMTVARQQGLVAIWRATNQWPDFCADRSLSYDCRKLAGAA